jgi:hypothetical protein
MKEILVKKELWWWLEGVFGGGREGVVEGRLSEHGPCVKA